MNAPFEGSRPAASRLQPRSPLRRVIREILFFSSLIAVVFAARWSLADHYVVPTGSMEPSVLVGDRVLVDRLAYDLRLPFTDVALLSLGAPARGDVVVFPAPTDGTTFLKRVTGLPGDLVEVRGGRLRVNGSWAAVEERPDGQSERLGDRVHPIRLGNGGPDWGPYRIPPGMYLVMGDNRGNSFDGRSFGLVPRAAIQGRASKVYFRQGLVWLDL